MVNVSYGNIVPGRNVEKEMFRSSNINYQLTYKQMKCIALFSEMGERNTMPKH